MTAPGSDAGAGQRAGGVSGTEPAGHDREPAPRENESAEHDPAAPGPATPGPATPGPAGHRAGPAAAPAAPAAPAVPPLLPDQSREDTDAAWGEYPESADDRLYRDRPPHWDNS
jgi:hypothetical protein